MTGWILHIIQKAWSALCKSLYFILFSPDLAGFHFDRYTGISEGCFASIIELDVHNFKNTQIRPTN